MANVSLDKEMFLRRIKRLYAAWKVSVAGNRVSRDACRSRRAKLLHSLIQSFVSNRMERSAPMTVSVKWIVSFLPLALMKISFIASP